MTDPNVLLRTACNKRHLGELLAAIVLGADPNHKLETGHTPITIALEEPLIAEAMIKLGANVDHPQHSHFQSGSTPLQICVNRWHVDTVTILLSNGANPNRPDLNGNTALHYLVGLPNNVVGPARERSTTIRPADKKRLLDLLLAHGADPTLENNDGENVLALARRSGDNALSTLLEHSFSHGVSRSRR